MSRGGVIALGLVLLLSSGAAGDEEERFLALSSAVVAAHDRADLLEAKEPRAAALELDRALALTFPATDQGRQLRADLLARLSALRLAGGDAAGALAAARQGLAERQGWAESAFDAQLRLREGEALEALGDEAGALDAYGTAIGIAKRLLAVRHEKEGGP